MGSVARMTFLFDDAPWEKLSKRLLSRLPASYHESGGLPMLSFVHAPDTDVPVWWTPFPVRSSMIVAWTGGPRARALLRHGPDDIRGQALGVLARALGTTRRRLEARTEGWWMHDWDADPFSRGAYSYVGVGGSDASKTLSRPAGRTLFFAGEAADAEGRNGTVHGAIGSGRRAAKQVLRALA